MKYISKIFLAYLMLILVLCSCAVRIQKIGIDNPEDAANIVRANKLARLRHELRFDELVIELKNDLIQYEKTPYAVRRIHNELADIYTRNLMDIELAVGLDEMILLNAQDEGRKSIAVNNIAASGQIIGDNAYVSQYINIDEKTIQNQAAKRLEINRNLLTGIDIATGRKFSEDYLIKYIEQVKEDLEATREKSPERMRMISRLIRGEYELIVSNPETRLDIVGYSYFTSGEIKIRDIDYNEINFLSLSRYLQKSFDRSAQPVLADLALQAIYRPYINLRSVESRWTYNKLVNELLNSLIETTYLGNKYEDMLYFASLNKSRMILEDQANNIRDKNSNLSSIIRGVKTLDKSTGLPSRVLFLEKLKLAKNYLDIYVVGSYKITQKNSAEYAKSRLDSSQSISSTRAVGVARKANTEEIPVTNKLIVSYIKNGKVVSVEQKSMAEANQLQAEYDTLYENVSGGSEQIRGVGVTKTKPRSSIISSVKNRFYSGTLDDDLAVSPDKWVSKYPFSYLFGARTTRSLNLLSLGDSKDLRDIKLVGYFNPLIDHPRGPLPGAEEEAKIIKKIIPDAEIHLRADASLRTINQPSTSNIVHLSMHGMNNSEEPTYSKLLFAGSSFNESNTDVNALYAKDMLNISQLKGNELIFTAACETGLTRGSSKNASELLGILRPLLINDNKNIILTLWEVDDASTMDFVRYFYQDLARGKNIKTAFYRAVDELKKKYPNPSDWAAFYLIQNG